MAVSNQARARQFLARRNLPYTVPFFLRQSAARYVVMLAAFGAILLGCWLEPADWAIKTAIFFTGWTCAVVWRDSAWFRAIKSAWPFTVLVTDWAKVQELAEQKIISPPVPNPNATYEMSSESQIAKIPVRGGSAAVPTGAIQFQDDWPGLFIRGDDAIVVATDIIRLQSLVTDNADPIVAQSVIRLRRYAKIIQQDVIVR